MTVLRRMLQVLLLLATLVVGAAALAIIVSQTSWFRDWLRGVVIRQANQYLNGTLSIRRLGGNLFFGIEIEDLGILQNGERVVAIKNLGLDYSVVRFFAGDVALDHIRVDRPQILLRREADKWNLAGLVKKERQEKDRKGPGRSVSIGEIGITDGRIVVDPGPRPGGSVGTAGSSAAVRTPTTIERLDARFSFAYEPVHYSADIAHLSFRTTSPALDLNALSGKIAVRDDTLWLDQVSVRTAESSVKVDGQVTHYLSRPELKLQASSDKLSLPEVGRFVPVLSMPVQPSFRVTANGPLDKASFDFALKSSAGDASGQITANLLSPERRIAGTVHVGNVDLAPITKTPAAKSRITGVADIDLRFPSVRGKGPVFGTFKTRGSEASVLGYSARDFVANGRVDARNRVTLTHATASAYGARGSAAGTIQPGVRGPSGARGVLIDLHGAVAGLDLRRLPRQLKVPPAESRLTFDYHVAGVGAKVSGDAALQQSTLAGATLGAGTKASFSNLGPEIEYGADGTAEQLDLQRVGHAFRIEALTADRFGSSFNGTFTARGKGTTIATLGLDAKASLTNSTLNGMLMPSMDVEGHIANGGGKFRATGDFANLDPARVSGNSRVRGRLSGKVDADLGLEDLTQVTPDNLSASGSVSLAPSAIGELAIDRANVEGEYSASTAHVTRFDLAGPDVGLNGKGTVALGTTGSSDFTYHLESPKLAMIGRIVGQPLSGALTLDGAVSGNRTALKTTGTLKGSDIGYRENRALGLQGRYEAIIPDLDAARATVSTDAEATLLNIGNQQINQLLLKGTYSGQQLNFDATARTVPREAHVVGSLLLHTDHQEVHLTQFALRTQGLEWTLPEGRQPVIQYAGGRIQVKGVRLISGQQTINAEGVIDPKASDLRASITDIDLARLDTWLVGERRLGGILNAGAHITGPSAALLVKGDFSIDHGAFREFQYETFGGNVNYTGGRFALDVRLFQSPEAWIAAKGTVPTAMWSVPAAGAAAPNAAADSPVDLSIDSSPIDLGLVQGFTGAITKASGKLEAHVKVSGKASDPQMSGGVGFTNGAFTVVSTNVGYTSMNGRVDLEPGRAVFNKMSVTDEHGSTMSVTGDVTFERKALGNLALTIDSRKFEVLHNDVGRAVLDGNVKVSGQVRAPRVEGTVSVANGHINIDKVLDLTSSSAYSTKPQNAVAPSQTASSLADPTMPGSAGRMDAAPHPAVIGTIGTVPTLPPAGTTGTSGKGSPSVGVAAARSPYDAMVLNVRVRVPSDFIVKGKDLRPGGGSIGLGDVNVTLGGDVRLQKKPDAPLELIGQVTTVRGTYDFQGRRFDIQRDGRVRFEGVLPIDPALDVTATRVISGVETRVHVGGSARRPELTLTSRPPLDQADILALIVFNQPANQLGEGEQASLAERAGALATGFVASKLADSIGRALNLDTFEIQTAPESSGGQGARVTIGEQVGQRLFLKLSQGVGSENLSQFVLEYQFNDYLRFQSTITQGDSATRSLVRRVERSGVDLIFFFSY